MILISKKINIKIFDYVYIKKGKYKGKFGKIILINKKKVFIINLLKNYQITICLNIANLCLL